MAKRTEGHGVNKTSYHSKLVGVSFEGRQETISQMDGSEQLRFRREPENEYDSNAIAVDALTVVQGTSTEDVHKKWLPIGYIAKDKNSELASVLDEGKEASIEISEITGGGDKNIGVNVYIEYEKKRKLLRSPKAELVTDIFGNQIFYDDDAHKYTNSLGEVYMSGSQYASSFERPFDAKMISSKMASKHGLTVADAQRIQDMWRLKALASASFGTAIHAAIELYGRYKTLAESVSKDTHFHDNPVLYQAVKLFYDEHPETDNIEYECLVVDHSKKRAGRVDRLEYDENGDVWVSDFKTNFDINKSIKKFWLQLSFYAAIIEANGTKVKGLKVYHYTGKEWTTILGEVINIDKETK